MSPLLQRCGVSVDANETCRVSHAWPTLQVFVSDKKRSKEFGGTEAFNRIKKEMVKEMKGLGPEEKVLLVGCSAAPQMCVKKDEKAFLGFFDKHINLPLPDYASRLVHLLSCWLCVLVVFCLVGHHYSHNPVPLPHGCCHTCCTRRAIKLGCLWVQKFPL